MIRVSTLERRLGLFLLLASGCVHASPPPAATPTAASVAAATTPDERYARAVADAAEADADEVYDGLREIRASTAGLEWEGTAGTSRVRVVTWTSWDGYDADVGHDVPLGREVWVTAVPDVRQACRAFVASGNPLVARLAEYLGLPPNTQKTRMVELWVETTDLFRPCPDAEIDDDRCGLDFPSATTDAHRTWIEEHRSSSYGPNGYPWTRLGYTYDWGHDDRPVGASEFVVRSGARVGVAAVWSTETYCAPRAD